MKRIKFLTIVLCMIVMTSLVGAKKKSVDLLKKSLLIDLEKSIYKADFGTGGNKTEKEEGKNEQQNSDSDKQDAGNQDKEDDSKDSGDKSQEASVVVSVRDTIITLDGKQVSDADELKKTIMKKYPSGVSISLGDDYAKADTFHEVIEVMEQLKNADIYSYHIISY